MFKYFSKAYKQEVANKTQEVANRKIEVQNESILVLTKLLDYPLTDDTKKSVEKKLEKLVDAL